MTIISRKDVRDEIVTGLSTAVAGSGKVFSSVYGYQIGKLDGESPVLLVLNAPIRRFINGIGTQTYRNVIELELHILIYDGDKNQPLTESAREDKMDNCEAAIADWFAAHQSGTKYQAAEYTSEPSTILNTNYLDGNPYKIEVIKVQLEARDQ